jgi:threonine dehydratase
MRAAEPIGLADVEAARGRIGDLALRTPLVRLNAGDGPAEIFLKLENLQPIASFKLRGAANAILLRRGELKDGVVTVSAGNMAQGVAYVARRLGIPARCIVPEHAPDAKLSAIERLGAQIVKVPFDEWWAIMGSHDPGDAPGAFIHPVSDLHVMAGHGTIGLEILEDCPDVDAVVVPFGGGGLSCGIASVLRAANSRARVIAAEVETAAPLAAALGAGAVREVGYVPSFVEGIGGRSVLTEMWPLVRDLVSESIVVSLDEVAEAIRMLVRSNKVVAEGAGAAPVAAALTGSAGGGRIVCVVSGGNIDATTLATILDGRTPSVEAST